MEFYEENGVVMVRQIAGGHGGGATSFVVRRATDAEAAAYWSMFPKPVVAEPVVEPVAEPEAPAA